MIPNLKKFYQKKRYNNIEDKILHYKSLKKLGEGRMVVIYLAEDTKLERHVAIKFLMHQISKNSDERKRCEIKA
jgi:serine/threonine protein kinase